MAMDAHNFNNLIRNNSSNRFLHVLSNAAGSAAGLEPTNANPTKVDGAMASADKSLGKSKGAKVLNHGLKALSGQTLVHLIRKKVF